MCEHLSVIVARYPIGQRVGIFFSADDSHTTIASGLPASLHEADGVPAECLPPYTCVGYETDLPAWYQAKQIQIERRIMALAERIAPLDTTYWAHRAKPDAPYWAERAKLEAPYEAERAKLDAPYEHALSGIRGFIPTS